MDPTPFSLDYWQDALRRRLPAPVLNLLGRPSSRSLLARVDTVLLVSDTALIQLGPGTRVSLSGPDTGDAAALAEAAQHLLSDRDAQPRILLLLPPDAFVATPVSLPPMPRDALVAALQLQAESLLPALTEPLSVAAALAPADGATHLALWTRQAQLDSLFEAFSAQGLLLVGVMPRVLYPAPVQGGHQLLEEAEARLTAVNLRQGVIHGWLTLPCTDLDEPVFAQQWEAALASDAESIRHPLRHPEDYAGAVGGPLVDYAFVPPGANRVLRRLTVGRQVVAAAVLLGVLCGLAAAPFLVQSFQLSRLQQQLESLRELAAGPRADRQAVQQFESEWGPLVEFPDQDVRAALFGLEAVLQPERLQSFEIAEGQVSIEGDSDDPQAILQRLEQDPRFTEVTFARATNNRRYFIDLRLTSVNFDAYRARHFPER